MEVLEKGSPFLWYGKAQAVACLKKLDMPKSMEPDCMKIWFGQSFLNSQVELNTL